MSGESAVEEGLLRANLPASVPEERIVQTLSALSRLPGAPGIGQTASAESRGRPGRTRKTSTIVRVEAGYDTGVTRDRVLRRPLERQGRHAWVEAPIVIWRPAPGVTAFELDLPALFTTTNP